jgi:hypothetical protein
MEKFTNQNWNYAQFTDGSLKAIIGLGASPEILDDSFIYFVSVLDEDNNEIHQAEFNQVETACDYVNEKYSGIWSFNDLSKSEETGGCGSCSAH